MKVNFNAELERRKRVVCYHPNVLFYRENSIIKKDGTPGIHRIKIYFANDPNFKGYEYYHKLNEKLRNQEQYGEKLGYKLIPCGKCKQCKINQKQEWATRIELETKQYPYNYFITLTYNPENIKIPDQTVNKITGEIYQNDGTWKGTLVKEDLQLFLKSTRKWFERDYNHTGCKFYASGEYGEVGNLPHYHLILMNCPKLDQEFIGQNDKGIYHTNKRLENIWHKGFITIEKTNWDTIAYTAGYVEKKLFGELKEEYHAKQGQIPIFAQMSRRPGIGRKYFEENYENIYKCDEIINGKGEPIRPPSYFDRLMDIGEHDVMQEIKKQRTINTEAKRKTKMSQTDVSFKEQLLIEERTAIEKDKKYRRKYKIL